MAIKGKKKRILAIKTRNIAERCRFLPVRQVVRRGPNENATL
jgi:hypothetical protein